MHEDEPDDFVSGVHLPILERQDYTRAVRGLPPMPRSLLWIILITRLLPAVTELALSLVIATNPPDTGLFHWINASYGFSQVGFAAWLVVFAAFSIWWSVTGRWRRFILLRVGGNILFTFPLLFYVLCADWYILTVVPTPVSRSAVVLYSSGYVTMMALYAKNAALSIWFDQVRHLQQRQEGSWT